LKQEIARYLQPNAGLKFLVPLLPHTTTTSLVKRQHSLSLPESNEQIKNSINVKIRTSMIPAVPGGEVTVKEKGQRASL
jgi:hypothetical protein